MKSPLARFYLLGFLALMLCDTGTKIALKLVALQGGVFTPHLNWFHSVSHTWWLYVAIAGYLGSFIMWMNLLKYAPVSLAFAISHMDFIPILLISIYYFHEPVHLSQMIGTLLITLGIISISFGRSPKRT